MLNVDEVLKIIETAVSPIAPVPVPIGAAAGSVLAQDVRMIGDSPPFDRAVLDGFAVRSGDLGKDARVKLVGRILAGEQFSGQLGPGQCVGINTGAPMPTGADAVLMVEDSRAEGDTIIAAQAVKPGTGVQRRGADACDGDVVLASGTRLAAAQIAVAATAGASPVLVRSIRAALLTTGDELVSPEIVPGPGQIRNANQPMLAALIAQRTNSLADLGTCGDHEDELRKALQRGLQEDLLVVTGGMSMGTKDLVPPLLKELGVEILVEKVLIKPGKPFIFGTRRNGTRSHYVAGLPGNPVSAFVTFHRFVHQIMRQLTGESGPSPSLTARTRTALPPNGDREFYQPCRITWESGGAIAEVMPWKGSADVFTLSRAQGLVIRPAGAAAADAGALVNVMLL